VAPRSDTRSLAADQRVFLLLGLSFPRRRQLLCEVRRRIVPHYISPYVGRRIFDMYQR